MTTVHRQYQQRTSFHSGNGHGCIGFLAILPHCCSLYTMAIQIVIDMNWLTALIYPGLVKGGRDLLLVTVL